MADSRRPAVSDADCSRFLKWALPRLGMRWAGFRKVRRQVRKRIRRRIGRLQLPDLEAYRRYLETHPDEWHVLDSFCRISVSRFYRDREVFDLIRDRILPELADAAARRGETTLRCWSAGCASGEEPYTLSIIWHLVVNSLFPRMNLAITATDADEHLLLRAERACYDRSGLKELPNGWISRAFEPAGDQLCLREEMRAGVEFLRQDIRHEMPGGKFHLLLCRNLAFTYFDDFLQRQVASRLASRMQPGGYLVLGRDETLPEGQSEFKAMVDDGRAWEACYILRS